MMNSDAEGVLYLGAYRPVSGFQRAAAVSGVIFAVLYVTSLVLLRIAVPADPRDPGEWLADAVRRDQVRVALNLVPFAGISFLWFMAVLRERLGLIEARFITPVFLGSGLLFVAMLFTAAAAAQGLLHAFGMESGELLASDAYRVSRGTVYGLMNPFGIRMAAVFMFVTSSMGLRVGLLPRWVVVAGFVCAVVLLVIITDFAWVGVLFPCWVMLVSASLLVGQGRLLRFLGKPRGGGGGRGKRGAKTRRRRWEGGRWGK